MPNLKPSRPPKRQSAVEKEKAASTNADDFKGV